MYEEIALYKLLKHISHNTTCDIKSIKYKDSKTKMKLSFYCQTLGSLVWSTTVDLKYFNYDEYVRLVKLCADELMLDFEPMLRNSFNYSYPEFKNNVNKKVLLIK